MLPLFVFALGGRALRRPRQAYSNRLMAHLPIHQSGDGAYPLGMVPPVLPIRLRQRPIPPQPPNGMFHLDPPPRKCPVVDHIVRRALLAPRLAPRRRAQALGMEGADANIR